jgi:hypothetical protein
MPRTLASLIPLGVHLVPLAAVVAPRAVATVAGEDRA